MIRAPVVSGQFYPDNKRDLERMIQYCISHRFGPKVQTKKTDEKVFGVICPHAGYEYSGPTACHSFNSVAFQNPELVIITGPNHFGVGQNVATMSNASWQTPLGNVLVDSELSEEISNVSKFIEIDNYSHSRDHSLEVQIPMLQYTFSKKFQIIPIILLSQNLEVAIDVGNSISEIAKKKKTLVIGSSDFTHYEENSFAYLQDKALIEPILKMDVKEFYQVLHEKRVSACGYGAIASTMIACKNLGATRGELLSYTTSGDVSGDKDSVVGYGAIKFV